jgi:hypothetical protein
MLLWPKRIGWLNNWLILEWAEEEVQMVEAEAVEACRPIKLVFLYSHHSH